MDMSAVPFIILDIFHDQVQELLHSAFIVQIVTVDRENDIADFFRKCMRDDIIDFVLDRCKIIKRFLELIFRRFFLRPPAYTFFTSDLIDTCCPAHDKEAAAVDLIDLTIHQMDHMLADTVDLAPVPHFDGIGIERVIVLMIAGYKKRGIIPCFMHVQDVRVLFFTAPDTAKISADDQIIITGKEFLLREVVDINFLHIHQSMGIAGDKNH